MIHLLLMIIALGTIVSSLMSDRIIIKWGAGYVFNFWGISAERVVAE